MINKKKPIALVIGNGPSVDQLPVKALEKFETYGCNHIYQKFSQWGHETDNIVITDSNRIQEIGGAYKNYKGNIYIGDERYVDPPTKKIQKIIGREFTPLRQYTKESYPINVLTRHIRFSRYLYSTIFDKWRMTFDLEKGLNFGRSVVCSAIQLAAIHGHRKILMTGVDSRYDVPKAYFEGAADKIEYVNSRFISDPRLYMEPFLVILQIYLEREGIKLYDCTPGGALKFVDKKTMESYF